MSATLDRAKAVLRRWRLDPVAMVREEFGVDPDLFQIEALEMMASGRINRLALKACKGPGKTAVLAWIILWFLATRGDNTKIGCTSITGDNIDMNLWPELSKWMGRSEYFRTAFRWSKSRVEHRTWPDNWFAERRTWPKTANADQQADALAGLHADHVMFVLDESGGIPQAVMVTAEAILATEGQEAFVLQAGNPTHTTGPLYRACTADRHLWHVITITGDPKNPKRSKRISLEWATQQIASFGRDNPWVRVNVLGEFPESSINALLGAEEVERAMNRHYTEANFGWSQKRLGVDVARFGDDRTVVFPRQGQASFPCRIMRNVRTTDIAASVAMDIVAWDAELVLVDDTGHWGHGVIDNLVTGGYPAIGINFAEKALNRRYKNRRAEMWLEMAAAVKRNLALPHIPSLIQELIEPTYTFVGGVFVLEEKDQIKERIGRSPDLADALALTFALPDQPSRIMDEIRGTRTATRDRDPFSADDPLLVLGGRNRALRDKAPFDD